MGNDCQRRKFGYAVPCTSNAPHRGAVSGLTARLGFLVKETLVMMNTLTNPTNMGMGMPGMMTPGMGTPMPGMMPMNLAMMPRCTDSGSSRTAILN